MWLAKPSSRVIFSAQCDDRDASWSPCVQLLPRYGRCFSVSWLACSSGRSKGDVPRAGAWTLGKSPCHWIEHTGLKWGVGSCQLPQRRAGLKECLMSCWGEGCPASISRLTPAGTSFLHSYLGSRGEGSEGDLRSLPLKGVAGQECTSRKLWI